MNNFLFYFELQLNELNNIQYLFYKLIMQTPQPTQEQNQELNEVLNEVLIQNTDQNTNQNTNQNTDVKFGDTGGSESDTEDNDTKPDLSKYTIVEADNLSEDPIIADQKYCLLSFLSPEGVMNCNVRSVKFRGAFATEKEAQKYAEKLEKDDKYFKILLGDSGKWLDFDPPACRIDREMSSNKEYQKLLDAQSKQRMDKINTLAGKHMELVDKKDKGKDERKMESKKAAAASQAVEKRSNEKSEKTQKEMEKEEQESKRKVVGNPRDKALQNTKDRMRKKLEESQNKKKLDNLAKGERAVVVERHIGAVDSTSNLDEKIKLVGKANEELENKKMKLESADESIEKIKRLMANEKAKKISNV
jgi:hypothetical protein